MSDPAEIIIVTHAAKLAGLIDDAVERAVRRAVAAVIAERKNAAEWLTTRDAVRAFGRSRTTLYRWRRDGLITTRKVGGTVYFARPVDNEA